MHTRYASSESYARVAEWLRRSSLLRKALDADSVCVIENSLAA